MVSDIFNLRGVCCVNERIFGVLDRLVKLYPNVSYLRVRLEHIQDILWPIRMYTRKIPIRADKSNNYQNGHTVGRGLYRGFQ
jgi:hypothetical protein